MIDLLQFAFWLEMGRVLSFLFFWVFIPLVLFIVVKDLWLRYQREKFIQKFDWILLEVIPPREIKKTPQAVEQILAGLHGVQRTPNWWERNIGGELQEWFSLETVGLGGEIHFFIRTLNRYRNLVEAQIYAQYPEAEIYQVDDYTALVPSEIPNQDYDLWGSELVLLKADAYPIRTYPSWEKGLLIEEQRVDPLASLMEVMSHLTPGEQIWIQILIRPVLDDWKREGEALRDKLIGRQSASKSPGVIRREAAGWKEAVQEVAYQMLTGKVEGGPGQPEAKPAEDKFSKMTKQEQEVVKAIEDNLSKIGYEVVIRFLYLGQKDVFNKANVSAVFGYFKQFNTQHLNGFKPNGKLTTKINYRIQFKHLREYYRKKKILAAYKKRAFCLYSQVISYLKPAFYQRWPLLRGFFRKSKPFVLNIEELASIYHFPGLMVKTPMLPRIQAKKGEPPVGLPIK